MVYLDHTIQAKKATSIFVKNLKEFSLVSVFLISSPLGASVGGSEIKEFKDMITTQT